MSKIVKGIVVKFYDNEGLLDGGTVIEIIEKEGSRICLINTLEGKRIQKNEADIVPIKYQRVGKPSSTFLNKVKKALIKENRELKKSLIPTVVAVKEKKETEEISDSSTPLPVMKVGYPDEALFSELKEAKERITELERRNEELSKNVCSAVSEDKYHKTIVAMRKSIICLTKGEDSEAMTSLLDLILELNDI
jgi:hypothetical protein